MFGGSRIVNILIKRHTRVKNFSRRPQLKAAYNV